MGQSDVGVVSVNKLSILSLGGRVKILRKKQRKSLQALGDEIGVSRSLLSQIERGEANPSINTLWNLADALGIHVGELFRSKDEEGLIVESAEIRDVSEGVRCYLLSSRVLGSVEIAYLEYSPGGSSGKQPAHHPGMEYLLVLDGKVEVTVGDRTFPLKQNNGIRYSARVPHSTTNAGRARARVLVIMTST